MWCREVSYSCFAVVTITCFSLQVDGPTYQLLLKKDKAHDMDVNSVKWSSMVNLLFFSNAQDFVNQSVYDIDYNESHGWDERVLSSNALI